LGAVEDRGHRFAGTDRLAGRVDRAAVAQGGPALVERRDLLLEPGLLLAAVQDRQLDRGLCRGCPRRRPRGSRSSIGRLLRPILPAPQSRSHQTRDRDAASMHSQRTLCWSMTVLQHRRGARVISRAMTGQRLGAVWNSMSLRITNSQPYRLAIGW